MLQNVKVIAFTVSALLRENQQGAEGGGGEKYLHPNQSRANFCLAKSELNSSACFAKSVTNLFS